MGTWSEYNEWAEKERAEREYREALKVFWVEPKGRGIMFELGYIPDRLNIPDKSHRDHRVWDWYIISKDDYFALCDLLYEKEIFCSVP